MSDIENEVLDSMGEEDTILKIAVVKGKGEVDVNVTKLPIQYYKEAVARGLKDLVNGGMTKINKDTYINVEQLKAAAMELAMKRVGEMMAGTLKLRAVKAEKGISDHTVIVEARRLAKQLIKDAMKEAGLRQSHYTSSEITKAANEAIEANPDLMKMARANIEARGKTALPFDVKAHVKPDDKLVAKANKAKAEKVDLGTLSKTQAGKVAPRAIPAHAH